MKALKEATAIAAKAMQEYTRNKVSFEFMDKSEWLSSEDKFTFEFELIDKTNAKPVTLPKGEIGITGWKIPPKHLLTVYVDKLTGSSFIRRYAPIYPWEEAA